MAEDKAKFPAPEDSDADDVVLALETANALWGRSDSKEAIRWLRRAAEAAEEAGNDMRSLTLARTAADLTTQLEDEGRPTMVQAPTPSRPPPSKPIASTPPPKPLRGMWFASMNLMSCSAGMRRSLLPGILYPRKCPRSNHLATTVFAASGPNMAPPTATPRPNNTPSCHSSLAYAISANDGWLP